MRGKGKIYIPLPRFNYKKEFMKKVILLFATMAIVFASCQNKTAYKVEGTVADANLNGKYVYLQENTDSAIVNVDSMLLADGKFQFKGDIEKSKVHFITLDQNVQTLNAKRVMFLLEPGTITVNIDTIPTVGGTAANDDLNDFMQHQFEFTKTTRAISNQYNEAMKAGTMNDSLEASINAAYEKEVDAIKVYNFDFIKKNMNNDLGQFLFLTSASSFEPKEQKELLNKLSDEYKAKPEVKRISTRLENLEKVAEGEMFADLTMENPEGETVSLSDYAGKGKYVFVDFWASWCGPCREEMPNVVEAYKKYKNKGFEIVGVSLDNSKDNWLKGIKDLNMTWPQMSDLKAWDSKAVEVYAFQGIPHTVLLDKDGKIIAKNLRGQKLHEKLAELMK